MILFLASALALGQTAAPPVARQTPELLSPLGIPLFAQPDPKGSVQEAERRLTTDPRNLDLILALGKAQADLWRYRDALKTYTLAIETAPDRPLPYRHRGHRFISTRQFARAVEDLEKAAALDPSSFDIWYHLGLAHYLRGDFTRAASAYENCLRVASDPARGEKSRTDDSLVAVSDWLTMTYRRAGRDSDAAGVLERITPSLLVKENTSYFHRLLFYKGLRKESALLDLEKATDLEIATLGYGVGNWHLYNNRPDRAREIFRKIVGGKHWPAFGFIAAEAELVRAGK